MALLIPNLPTNDQIWVYSQWDDEELYNSVICSKTYPYTLCGPTHITHPLLRIQNWMVPFLNSI